MKKTLIQVSLAAALTASSAVSGFNREYKKAPVDIQFSRSQPVAEVYDTIRKKARRACRVTSVLASYHSKSVLECRRGVVEKAIAAIQWPELSALHERQTTKTRLAQQR
ncbi:MAG: hypothetical protein AAGA23_11470 [Pseudomonadota bacterium]